MHLYNIKHNGFTIGQKRGKKAAIEALGKHLDLWKYKEVKWTTTAYGIEVKIKGDDYNEFSIEEDKDND